MKKYGQGLFLSPKNTEEGDVITFLDAGVEGDYEGKGNSTFEVDLSGAIKKITLNPTSVQNLSEAWGWESSNWIGKHAVISFTEKPIQGDLVKYIVLNPYVGKADDVTPTPTSAPVASSVSVEDSDIPVIETAEEDMANKPKKKDKVNPQNIPF